MNPPLREWHDAAAIIPIPILWMVDTVAMDFFHGSEAREERSRRTQEVYRIGGRRSYLATSHSHPHCIECGWPHTHKKKNKHERSGSVCGGPCLCLLLAFASFFSLAPAHEAGGRHEAMSATE